MAVLLIRYSEIGLKGSAVRNRWENRMKDNLMQMLEADGVESLVEKGQARFYITAGDIQAAIRSVRKVFGVSSLSVAEELDSTDPEEICAALAEYSKTRMADGKTFAVRARREGGQKYTSMDIARQVGDAIWDANLDKHPKVNLSEPDITFWVEVRPKKTYYFQEYIYAHAGLPLGTQGRVVAYVDDDRGLLSAWLMMKRGCRVYVVGDYGLGVLRQYDPRLKVIDPGFRVERNLGYVFGYGLEEAAGFDPASRDRPAFFPTVGMTDAEVAERVAAIRKEAEESPSWGRSAE
ncbi:MAG: THUMP domain-containing protein [Candidatus Methanomethylophilus sp.]|jgi:thiamine biosynthesis protein ThiI|nr:THUMP domain-containing protein [Methanomethylophilus sp.]MCI2092487.1 THUMP domain-containing protein [Methanomethylophilus sp.]WII10012.1 THUMP domain-containing protein [Methanomassiliicoccales archaeon LGM-DZ1]